MQYDGNTENVLLAIEKKFNKNTYEWGSSCSGCLLKLILYFSILPIKVLHTLRLCKVKYNENQHSKQSHDSSRFPCKNNTLFYFIL